MKQPIDQRSGLHIAPAVEADVPVIRSFILALADYEKLSHEVVVTDELLRRHLFGPRPAAEAIIARLDGEAVGFVVFCMGFSTFSGRPGIWVEDLFVHQHARGRGVGRALLGSVARIARQRDCGHLEWSVLDWNEPSIRFYQRLGAKAMNGWTTYHLSGRALQELDDTGST